MPEHSEEVSWWGLDLSDVRFEHEGVRITVRKSKTDQEGAGHTKDINYAGHSANCPVKASEAVD